MNGPKITSPVSSVFLSQVISVWGSSLTSCKRQKPRPDEIEIVENVTHSLIWKCLECLPGSGMSIPCGTSVAFGISINCVNCVKGVNYSDTSDYSQCKSCRKCSPHEKSSGNCTPTKDSSSCLEICSKGFYWNNETSACDQCSDCCGQPLTYHEKQCEDSGLPVRRQCRATLCPSCKPQTGPTHKVIIVVAVTSVCVLLFAISLCVIIFSFRYNRAKGTGNFSQEGRELTVSFKKLKGDDDDLESVSDYRSASYEEGADNKRTSG